MKKITILGSTGSIGTQALDVIEKNSDIFEAVCLTCGSNIGRFEEQIQRFHPKTAVTAKEEDALYLQKKYSGTEFLYGEGGLIDAVKRDCDVVLNALMGMRGFVPTYEAVMAGKDVALANKETLVAGGEVIMNAVSEKGIRLTPVDSEHSAVFQCMQGQRREDIVRLLLTGSGGPFRTFTPGQMKNVTVSQALDHPNWSMGPKITIDSATLMNKGLEVIEAMWLFDFDIDDIKVVIHPQSIIHSMIEMRDGAVLAQMGTPDMKLPIAYALTCPARMEGISERLDLFGKASELTFEKPDLEKFRCLKTALQAAKAGGTYPAAMNGANEVLVSKFLSGMIGFTDIPEIIEKVMDTHDVQYNLSPEVILKADEDARKKVDELLGGK